MYNNLQDLAQDKELLIALVEAETADEFAALLKEKGVEIEGITKEEAFEAFRSQKDVEPASEELSVDSLDDVSGGVALAIGLTVASAAACVWLAGSAYAYYKHVSRR